MGNSRRKSRLSWYKQERQIEHFVAGTTARTALRRGGVHRNTAAHYFRRLHEIIAHELAKENEELPGERLRRMKAISVGAGKANKRRGRLEKCLFSASRSAAGKFT